jgi:hypothetical protein
MDQDLSLRLDALTQKVDAVYVSAEKTRKYLLWTLVISVAVFVIPLLALMFAIPSFLSSYTSALGGEDGTNSQNTQSLQQQLEELSR